MARKVTANSASERLFVALWEYVLEEKSSTKIDIDFFLFKAEEVGLLTDIDGFFVESKLGSAILERHGDD